MKPLIDSAWRAAAYCLHPKVILMSLLPLIFIIGTAFGLGYFFWTDAIDAVNETLLSWGLLTTFFNWLDSIHFGGLKSVFAPAVVVFLATPVLVVVSLLAVAMVMSPVMLDLVAQRRFPRLERLRGGSFAGSVFVSTVSTVIAMVAMVFSIPLWLVPPLVLVLPPLIWGWLTYRVMSYDTLAEHASKEERRELMRRHQLPLLAIGVLTGYLGAAPSLVWVSGVMIIPLAPVLVPLAIWIYMLVFAFSALWFAHYGLAALAELRAERLALPLAAAPEGEAEPAVEPQPVLPTPPA